MLRHVSMRTQESYTYTRDIDDVIRGLATDRIGYLAPV
jgi:hypothetical protein